MEFSLLFQVQTGSRAHTVSVR